ncbi:BTB/POZ domain-containing protein At1g21780-like isoform X2 [Euphorbia lathyris]|uniref:BTB/POZ domain-containing protein At1g21780-like isoform X2 n=1 Tax=Euphorbia lathyris TaxID=212925 RepID=UPI0033136954
MAGFQRKCKMAGFQKKSKTVDSKVEMISRVVRWKIEGLEPYSYKKSDAFKLGIWTWHLSVQRKRGGEIYVDLFPLDSPTCKEQSPIATFYLRIFNAAPNRRHYHTYFHERLLRNCNDYIGFETDFSGSFIIHVEFRDLKTCTLNGWKDRSIWSSDGMLQPVSTQSTSTSRIPCFSRMLDEAIHADVTINTADGTVSAHKAVLSASSPVFQSMFHHELKEKESSTIYIQDMTLDCCKALLSYLYGTIEPGTFWTHRIALIGAANKYDIQDLKDACEESLLEDLNSGNVLERLQEAWLYQLHKLKNGCLKYLIDFGMINDVEQEIRNNFFREADRELILELVEKMLAVGIMSCIIV